VHRPGVTPRATRTVRTPIFIHAPRPKVFRAITEPQLLSRWFMDRATLTPRQGGEYAFTWEGGHFPPGQAEYPVSGVSWYEASAYAAFIGPSGLSQPDRYYECGA